MSAPTSGVLDGHSALITANTMRTSSSEVTLAATMATVSRKGERRRSVPCRSLPTRYANPGSSSTTNNSKPISVVGTCSVFRIRLIRGCGSSSGREDQIHGISTLNEDGADLLPVDHFCRCRPAVADQLRDPLDWDTSIRQQ